MPRLMHPVVDGWKRCTKCGENRPFTSEFYPTQRGRPCGLGAICKSCVRELSRRWRANNPEKRKASAKAWRDANPERVRELRRTWNEANPEKALETNRAAGRKWRTAHPDAERAKSAAYHATHKEQEREYRRAWKASNRIAVRAYEHTRRARKMQSVGSYTAADVHRILTSQALRCFYCQCDLQDGYHIEHRTPLARGGSNTPANLVCACPSCNLQKHTKTEHEFIWNTPRRRIQSERRYVRPTSQIALPIEGV